MKKTRPTLIEIRAGMTPFQTSLLQEIWQHFRAKGGWPTLRILYNRHDKQKVFDALSSLGRSVGCEERGSSGLPEYRLSFLGVFLTSDGPGLHMLMTRFFHFQRELFQRQPEKPFATSEELSTALALSSEEATLMGQLLSLSGVGGSRNPTMNTWTVSAMPEAVDFPKTGDLSNHLEDWLLQFYSPGGDVFEEQRLRQYDRERPTKSPGATLQMQPHPPEITLPLERLRKKYPDPTKLGFLIMRFADTKPLKRILKVIKTTAKAHGLTIIRADENDFHADLWGNVRTLLHGCYFGIAVYERIDKNEPNANVGLEVGYLMAMNKPVLLLKDKTVSALQSDLAGKLYKPFDPHDPEGTIPAHLTQWLAANGIIVPSIGSQD